jgi:hypothetical protein
MPAAYVEAWALSEAARKGPQLVEARVCMEAAALR